MTTLLGRDGDGSPEAPRALSALLDWARAEAALAEAERTIRLLERLTPVNACEERARLGALLERGARVEPRFVHAGAPELEPLEGRLSELADSFARAGGLGELYAERALELALEAKLVLACGKPELRALARERFDPDALYSPAEVEALAAAWLAAGEPRPPRVLVRSDDRAHPDSLWSVLAREIGARRLPVRVELRPGMSALAAAGEDLVAIRPGALLEPERAWRIARHELEGHVLPRLAARRESLGLLRVGARGSGEEEEGRALVIEERAGLFGPARRRELALRHRAAAAVRAGADCQETVGVLRALGAGPEQALDLALRAGRGGGLAREIVYLPAFLRVRAGFAAEPELERWFERGRVSLAVARRLSELEPRAASAPARAPNPLRRA